MKSKEIKFQELFNYAGEGFCLEVRGKPYMYSKEEPPLEFVTTELKKRGFPEEDIEIVKCKVIPPESKVWEPVG